MKLNRRQFIVLPSAAIAAPRGRGGKWQVSRRQSACQELHREITCRLEVLVGSTFGLPH